MRVNDKYFSLLYWSSLVLFSLVYIDLYYFVNWLQSKLTHYCFLIYLLFNYQFIYQKIKN